MTPAPTSAPPPYVFDLSGGALCLDFANTVSDRPASEPIDHLAVYRDLLAWARQARSLDDEVLAQLERVAGERHAEAKRALATALALREALFRLFSAVAAERQPAADDLATLNRQLAATLGWLTVLPDAGGYRWAWRFPAGGDGSPSLDAVLAPVARSAAELLTGDELGRLRECAAGSCRWLFLDRSRNRSRRWCDMAVCGNRAKARRHYRRQQSTGG